MTISFENILNKAEETQSLHDREIKLLLKSEGEAQQRLFEVANRIRKDYVGDRVHIRGVIEFSNYCRCHCQYCGLRQDNRELTRYRLQPHQIIETAEKAANEGYKTLVLQSGEDLYYNRERLGHIIKEIKSFDTAVTLSVGERKFQEYRFWKEMGADRFLLRHETASEKLYSSLHPGRELESRIKRLHWLKELGYQVGSGNIVGIPGQTLSSIVKDIKLFQELDLEMVGLGPFIPHERTPLAQSTPGKLDLTLNIIAVTRLLLPTAHIPGTTALGSISERGRKQALQVGANVIMPNVTNSKYRDLYNLYPGKTASNEMLGNKRKNVETLITDLDREIAEGYGHHQNFV